jgi:hypothetical protein
MRIEEEWSDAKTKDSHPEVDNMGDKDRHGDVEQEDQGSDTEVDRGPCESGAVCQYQSDGGEKKGYSL